MMPVNQMGLGRIYQPAMLGHEEAANAIKQQVLEALGHPDADENTVLYQFSEETWMDNFFHGDFHATGRSGARNPRGS